MKFSSLFSGAGGLDLGLELVRMSEEMSDDFCLPACLAAWLSLAYLYSPLLMQAGHELIFLCESDPGARQVRV